MKEDITIIDNYRDLSLGKYLEAVKIDSDERLDDLDKQVKIIALLTGKTESEILHLPIETYSSLAAKTEFLRHPLPEDARGRIAKSYNLQHFELIPTTDIRKISTAQYIDFLSLHKAGFESHIVEILSCILVPKGMKYHEGFPGKEQKYEISEVQSDIREHLSVWDALTLYAFFLISLTGSIGDILTYSRKEAMKVKDKYKRERLLERIQEVEQLLKTNGSGSHV